VPLIAFRRYQPFVNHSGPPETVCIKTKLDSVTRYLTGMRLDAFAGYQGHGEAVRPKETRTIGSRTAPLSHQALISSISRSIKSIRQSPLDSQSVQGLDLDSGRGFDPSIPKCIAGLLLPDSSGVYSKAFGGTRVCPWSRPRKQQRWCSRMSRRKAANKITEGYR